MKWITWLNNLSGNRTTRAHAVSTFLVNRTVCGWPIGLDTEPAPKRMVRCKVCRDSIKQNGADHAGK